ncbi:hypothetical protein ACRRTK_022096 [Alexandromys fortis]
MSEEPKEKNAKPAHRKRKGKKERSGYIWNKGKQVPETGFCSSWLLKEDGLPPAAGTAFAKVSIMALPSTFSSLPYCLSELQIPDHQTRVFQNTVPTCQHFLSFLFRPSAAEFLPAPKLNHFSLLLSLPTGY